MILVDTSVWIDVLRDAGRRPVLERLLGKHEVVLSRFTELELLQGARDEREWKALREYLEVQDYLEAPDALWANAARIHFDLRRKGLTVRSALDCCIAQLALDHDLLLLHRDTDFVTIGKVRTLKETFVRW